MTETTAPTKTAIKFPAFATQIVLNREKTGQWFCALSVTAGKGYECRHGRAETPQGAIDAADMLFDLNSPYWNAINGK